MEVHYFEMKAEIKMLIFALLGYMTGAVADVC